MSPNPLAFWDARLVDGRGGPPRDGMCVRVEGARIASVERRAILPRAPPTSAGGRSCPA